MTLPSLVPSRASACSCASETGDPKQTSGGTAPGKLAHLVREISDQLALGIRSVRRPQLPQELPELINSLLIDDLPADFLPTTVLPGPSAAAGGSPTGSPPAQLGEPVLEPCTPSSADRGVPAHPAPAAPLIAHTLSKVLTYVTGPEPLRWHKATDADSCRGPGSS